MRIAAQRRVGAGAAGSVLIGVALAAALLAPALAGPSPARAASTPAPYFTAIGSTTSSRGEAAAAPLPDGRVLIAGGLGGRNTAELFDPATRTFTAVPNNLLREPEGAIAAPLPDGRVLIAGGYGGGQDDRAELFDPADQTFTAVPAPMSTDRAFAVAAALPDGRVLIAGGDDSNAHGADEQTAELFDPATEAFTATGGMTSARGGAVAAPLPDGRVLVAGGYAGGSALRSAELFDPATGAFTALPASAEMTTAREYAAAAPLPDGEVLIAGGYGGGSRLRSAELFDPATGAFTALPASAEMTTAREYAAAAPLPDGEVLISGGYGGGEQTAELFVPPPQVAAVGGDFGQQAVAQASAAATVSLTNLGAQALRIGGVSLRGADPADFTVLADDCSGRSLAYRQICTLSVRFIPAAAGSRSASLLLSDNEPSPTSVPLTGSGVAQPQGPPGQDGVGGGAGPAGPRGPAGAPAKVTCKVKKTKSAKKIKVSCKVRGAASASVARLRHRGRTVARRHLAAGTHRVVFTLPARRGAGGYRLVL